MLREHFTASTEAEAEAMAKATIDHPDCSIDTIPPGPVAPVWTVIVAYEERPRPN